MKNKNCKYILANEAFLASEVLHVYSFTAPI